MWMWRGTCRIKYQLLLHHGIALFGLYDYYITTKNVDIKEIFHKSCKTMATKINKYDCGYWSMYDLVGTIASPAYHDLDIALLSVLSDLSGQENMKYYL